MTDILKDVEFIDKVLADGTREQELRDWVRDCPNLAERENSDVNKVMFLLGQLDAEREGRAAARQMVNQAVAAERERWKPFYKLYEALKNVSVDARLERSDCLIVYYDAKKKADDAEKAIRESQ